MKCYILTILQRFNITHMYHIYWVSFILNKWYKLYISYFYSPDILIWSSFKNSIKILEYKCCNYKNIWHSHLLNKNFTAHRGLVFYALFKSITVWSAAPQITGHCGEAPRRDSNLGWAVLCNYVRQRLWPLDQHSPWLL